MQGDAKQDARHMILSVQSEPLRGWLWKLSADTCTSTSDKVITVFFPKYLNYTCFLLHTIPKNRLERNKTFKETKKYYLLRPVLIEWVNN